MITRYNIYNGIGFIHACRNFFVSLISNSILFLDVNALYFNEELLEYFFIHHLYYLSFSVHTSYKLKTMRFSNSLWKLYISNILYPIKVNVNLRIKFNFSKNVSFKIGDLLISNQKMKKERKKIYAKFRTHTRIIFCVVAFEAPVIPFTSPSPLLRHWHSEHSSGGISSYIRESPPRSQRFYVDKFLSPLLHARDASYIIGRFNPCARSAGWKQIFSLFRKQYRRWKSCANNETDCTRFRGRGYKNRV